MQGYRSGPHGSTGFSRTAVDPRRLDETIRLFQNVLEALLLHGVEPAHADRVRPAAERDWFCRLAPLTGIATAARLDGEVRAAPVPAAVFTFHPLSCRLEELYEAHRATRASIRAARSEAERAGSAQILAVLGTIGRELRRSGLQSAYVAAARRAQRRARLGKGLLASRTA